MSRLALVCFATERLGLAPIREGLALLSDEMQRISIDEIGKGKEVRRAALEKHGRAVSCNGYESKSRDKQWKSFDVIRKGLE